MKHVLTARGLSSVFCFAGALFASVPLEAAVTDVWAGIETHPAVVNPVSVETFGRGEWNLSLAGEWDFIACNHGSGNRITRYRTDLWAKKGARKINVPSVWEAEGVGEEGMGIPHLCQDNSAKTIRHVFAGEGWYRKYVDIPASWAGKRIWLKAGGVRSQGCFFVNDNPVAWLDSMNGAHKWDVTPFVKPGERTKVVVMADNVVGHRGGPSSSLNRWGGIWRDIELEATPEVYIDDAWVRGDYDRRFAEAHVVIAGTRKEGRGNSVRVTVEGETVEVPLTFQTSQTSQTSQTCAKIALSDFRAWTPETPNLYWAKIELVEDGTVTMTRYERFGVRKLEVRGKELYLNGHPFFVRGFGDNQQFPLTGTTPPDRTLHRRHLAAAHAAGFNYVRHHTHTETPEYFEAADELGILIQPEIPYYLDAQNDYFSWDPIRDVDEITVAFRRYVSFATYSLGNEGMLGPAADGILYRHLKERDPDRMVIAQDGGTYVHPNHGEGVSDYCGGPLMGWARGSFNPNRPFVCHEYMNLAAKFDWRDAKDYTGVWLPPATEEKRREHLAAAGLDLDWLCRLQDAAHALQGLWQKRGLELARADPYCDGYIYWTITDSSVFNRKIGFTVGQGLFDPFWRAKRGGLRPEQVAVFNSAACVLLDTEPQPRVFRENPDPNICCSSKWACYDNTNRVFEAGEEFLMAILFANYSGRAFESAKVSWRLVADGVVLADGSCDLGEQKEGPARVVLAERVAAPSVGKPVRAMLEVEISDRQGRVANAWPFWFFPKRATDKVAVPPSVAVVPFGSPEAEAARAAGKNLVLLANQTCPANYNMGWWWIGKQAGTAFKPHPALGDFPYEPSLEALHFRMIKEGTKLPVEGFSVADYICVGESERDANLHLAAKTCPDGRREVFVSGLDVSSGTVEGDSLLANLVRWAAGER